MDRATEAGLILRPLNSGSLAGTRRDEEIGEREVEEAIGEKAVAMLAGESEHGGRRKREEWETDRCLAGVSLELSRGSG